MALREMTEALRAAANGEGQSEAERVYEAGLAAGRAQQRPTTAPVELGEFVNHCRAMGLRGYKGEFVASDGTRIPCEFMFDRQQKGRDDG